jgi:hypothetical protein
MRRDIIGQRFGRLIARELVGKRGRSVLWRCECECGRFVDVVRGNLMSGNTRSCGCMIVKRTIERSTTHGDSSRSNRSPEYVAWSSMIQRCACSKNALTWKNYGGRGIRVCSRWRESFANFLADVGRRPSAKHSLDRIDVNGNYEPGNVRWATRSQQQRNKRSTESHFATR